MLRIASLLLLAQTEIVPDSRPPCDVLAKLREVDPVFEAADPKIGQKTHTYTEIRRGKLQRITQPEREIALRVLHLDSCTTEVITIIKKGSIAESPPGWHVQVDVRSNGIQWNGVNSQYDVQEPADVVVLMNKVPDFEAIFAKRKDKKGKVVYSTKTGKPIYERVGWRKVKDLYYVPYTRAVHKTLVVSAGNDFYGEAFTEAFARLRTRQVYSRAVPNRLVADLYPKEWFYRLGVNEHMDYGESSLSTAWSQWSAERALVIVALNQNRTNIYNCNFAGACGQLQFTDKWVKRKGKLIPGTYSTIVRGYPEAGLIREFPEGALDLVNVIIAAVLHHDNIANKELVPKYGQGIWANPYIEDVFAVAFNCAPRSRRAAIDAALKHRDPLWYRKLRKRETREYIEKQLFLRTFVPNGAPLPAEVEQ